MVCLAHLRPGDNEVKLLPIVYGNPIPIRDGVYLINPGSVGQPRDGDNRAAYAILDVVNGTITYHRIAYDVVRVLIEMQDDRYPEVLVERLGTGRIRDTEHFENVYKQLDEGKGVVLCGAQV
jgi:hypothetical protein